MLLARRTIIQWVFLLCLTLLVTRIAGIHLHLCFDGIEPPVSFHTTDADVHHADDSALHDDEDIELPSATLAKAVQHQSDAALLFVVLGCLTLILTPRRPTFDWRTPVLLFTSSLLLRPPTRGPPRLLSI